MNLPPKADLTCIVEALVAGQAHYAPAAAHFGEDEQDPFTLDLTVSIDTQGDDPNLWSYQIGDNSYMGSAYGYPDWAVTSISPFSIVSEVVADILDQLEEEYWQSPTFYETST